MSDQMSEQEPKFSVSKPMQYGVSEHAAETFADMGRKLSEAIAALKPAVRLIEEKLADAHRQLESIVREHERQQAEFWREFHRGVAEELRRMRRVRDEISKADGSEPR